MDKDPIDGNPLSFRVFSSATNEKTSSVVGLNSKTYVAGTEYTFKVKPRDQYGNLRSNDIENLLLTNFSDNLEIPVEADIFGSAVLITNLGEEYETEVRVLYNRATLEYDGVFLATKSGPYKVNLWLINERGQQVQLNGSPFEVEVLSSRTDVRECSLVDESQIHDLIAGETKILMLQSRDSYGNFRPNGSDYWEIMIVNEFSQHTVFGEAIHQENGLYEIMFFPIEASASFLHITLNGDHISGSPFEMTVMPNVSFGASCFLLFDLTSDTLVGSDLSDALFVQTADRWKNNLTMPSGVNITATLSSNLSTFEKCEISYISAGLWKVDIVPKLSGKWDLSVRVNGNQIQKSPFTINVLEGAILPIA